MFRVIIAGGRDFTDMDLLTRTMDHLLSRTTDKIQIVCGKARGADTLGEEYAKLRSFDIAYYPANWDRDGKSAGFKRNVEMAKKLTRSSPFGMSKVAGQNTSITHGQKTWACKSLRL